LIKTSDNDKIISTSHQTNFKYNIFAVTIGLLRLIGSVLVQKRQ